MNPLAKRILTAAPLIPLVLALILWAPGWLFLISLTPVVYLSLWEYLELVARIGSSPTRLPVYALGFLLLGLGFLAPGYLLLALIGSGLLLIIIELLQRPALAELLPASAVGMLGLLYIAIPLALASGVREQGSGPLILVFTLLLVWTGDTAAYFVGRAVGRHKLAPRISPGKTIEGAAGSVLATVGVGFWLFRLWFSPHPLVHAIALPLGINVLAQLGDLAESALKRRAGVKDSSGLLPGHGGLLDRIDSLLFAIPTVWYYWGWLR